MDPPQAVAGSADAGIPTGQKQAEWDVGAPPGPFQKALIDVDEGTWMSLDVSPDGKKIVFDLLGDIYELPIAGGEARIVTEGVAWDMQPRYSPDGSVIAFTSDRGGGDNIWVMNADGSDPRPVTQESFRLLNSPVWTPDGQYIAARKHYTASRSLGAGEIWLYHKNGGEGVRMTKRPNQQKDVGEPAFSPDGRYLYFSRDMTSGNHFEYNKDPHKGIYRIRRLDREDGRVSTFIGGAGGAIRPTPSPDGKQLAYIRRDGLKTVLMVMDLKSGQRRPLFDGLDRDMQETWAIHGVYPQMAWTPDSESIVVWAQGKLHRVALGDGKVRAIPFHLRHERQVQAALRFPVEVAPERFDTKMLRWVQVAPERDAVVFQALGQIYLRELPEGKARRLTRGDQLEFYPSFSRDGDLVVFVSWDDEKLGDVRMVRRDGGRLRILSSEPGHYLEPVLSPDNKYVVYRKVRGGGLRDERWSFEPGLYATEVATGRTQLLSRSGRQPHFGAGSERVYFRDGEEKDGKDFRLLKSIELDGSDERTHVRSRFANQMRVSPDGEWLAYQELFDVYVLPFPKTGRPWEIGPKQQSIPQAKVNRDAGAYLHWSSRGHLHWSLGPELFSQDVSEAFAEAVAKKAQTSAAKGGEGARGKAEEDSSSGEKTQDPIAGINIGFSLPFAKPEGTVALVGARVVTMRDSQVLEDATIIVEGNRIKAMGPRGQTEIPKGSVELDLQGMTIIPGLVDVHAHGPQGQDGIIPERNWLHDATLSFGVTTIHDPSNDTATVFAASELAKAGKMVAPRIFSTGRILYGAETSFHAQIDSLDDARRHLRRMKAVGAVSVKSYNQPRRDQRQQIIAAARELEMMVVPEGGSLYQHNMTMVVDGHTGIEHALPVARGYGDLISLWSQTKVQYTPTIVVGYGGLWGENYWYQQSDVFAHPRLQRFVPPQEFVPRSRRRMTASEGDWNHISIAALCKQLLDAGVKINLGAHGQREGLAAHWEIWSFVQGGMTPMEALRAATLDAATYLGLDKDIGSLEVGKLADMAILGANPLENIRNSERVRYVVINGRVYDAEKMVEVGRKSEPRPAQYWVQTSPDTQP